MGRVVFVACTNVGRSMIEAVYNSPELKNVELAGVIDLKPEIAVNKANYDPYTDLVEKYGLNIHYCDNVNDPETLDFIRSCRADLLIQTGWSQKFHDELLDLPRYGCIGEHPAPLPRGRGAACMNWAILTGEKDWGDTFFKMEKQYDTGLMCSQEFFDIEVYDDVKTMYDKVAQAAVTAIRKHLYDWSEGRIEGKVQDDTASTHYPRRRPSDGEFDFGQGARAIYDQIRAQTRPYPGAFFVDKATGKKITVWKASLGHQTDDGGHVVICGDGQPLTLLRVQPEGCPECWGCDCKELKNI